MHRRIAALIMVVILVASVVSASGCAILRRPTADPPISRTPPVASNPDPATAPNPVPGADPQPSPTAPATPPTPPAPPQPSPPPPLPVTNDSGRIIRTGKIPVVSGIGAGTKRVALTFDAGWIYETAPGLLKVLADYQVKSTFFLRAAWVKDHPDLAKAIVAQGHDVQSHSFAHPDFTKMTDEQIRADLSQAQAAFRDVLGITPTLFRPPYGAYNKHTLEMLAEFGYKGAIMWAVDTIDWKEPGVDAIVKKAAGADDGSIVLMHVGSQQTIDALPQIITALRAKGFTLVTVLELLGDRLGGAPAAH
ncbi:MAG: polysaccharide deacetylase family protein [Chloroflexota bacterium]